MQGMDDPQHLRVVALEQKSRTVSAPGIQEWLQQRHRRRPLAAKGRQRDFTVGTLSPVQYWPSTNPCGVWQSR